MGFEIFALSAEQDSYPCGTRWEDAVGEIGRDGGPEQAGHALASNAPVLTKRVGPDSHEIALLVAI